MHIMYVCAYILAYVRVHVKIALYIRQNACVLSMRIRQPCCKLAWVQSVIVNTSRFMTLRNMCKG